MKGLGAKKDEGGMDMSGAAGEAVKEPRKGLWPLAAGFRAIVAGAVMCAAASAMAAPLPPAASVDASLGVVGSLTVERFGPKDAEAMGWDAARVRALDKEALTLAKRLEKRRGLPRASLSMARVAGEATSMARVEAGGECRVVLGVGASSEGSGIEFAALGLRADAEARQAALEQELLHELGHCYKSANKVAFDHPALSLDQNKALASSLFAADAAGEEGPGVASALFVESFADAFMAVKWLEGREFSEPAKATLRATGLFRKAMREEFQADGGAGFSLAPHMTEEVIEMALEASDELAKMSPLERERAAARIASQAAVRMLARSGRSQQMLDELGPELSWRMAQRALSLLINAEPTEYQAVDAASALGASLERLAPAAKSAAMRAAKAAGVDFAQGPAGLTVAAASRAYEAIIQDQALAEALRAEAGFLRPRGGLAESARRALTLAEAFERQTKPLRLSSLKGALAVTDWSQAPGLTEIVRAPALAGAPKRRPF